MAVILIRMRIAYLVSKYPFVSHTFVQREVEALRARGVQIGTFSIRRPRKAEAPGAEAAAAETRWLVGAPLREYALALLASLRRPRRLARVLANAVGQRGISLRQRIQWLCYCGEAALLARWLIIGGYEHLHCHFGNNGSSTGMLAAQLAGVPFSFTCHGSELLDSERNRLKEKVAQATFVACVSKYGRAQLMLLCPPEHWSKLHIVRCAALGEEHTVMPTVSVRPGHLLCVARLSREKGHLVLLEALALLRDGGRPVHCTLAGDGPMRATIETRIAELKLGDQVTLAGALCPDAVMELYPSAQIVVLPSFSEGVPVTLMEAMSQGVPVIATRVGGVAELVRHGRNGLLVSPGDATELAHAIGKLLARPALASRMAQRARHHLCTEFHRDRSADRLIHLFEQARSSAPTQDAQGEASCSPTLAAAGF